MKAISLRMVRCATGRRVIVGKALMSRRKGTANAAQQPWEARIASIQVIFREFVRFRSRLLYAG